MQEFDEKVVLVTGSGRGIGRAIALKFASVGANVIVNYFRNRKPAQETAAEIRDMGRSALVVKANVGNMDQLADLFGAIEKEFQHLDYYIHNAASGYNRSAMNQKPKGWEWTMNINAKSLLFGSQHAARLMRNKQHSAIVALSSLGSRFVFPDYSVVGASKAAVETLVRYLAVELAPINITVNAVCPGIVETDALLHFQTLESSASKLLQELAAKTPARRLVVPEDVANLVLHLCREESRMICGQTIILDGGHSLQIGNS